MRTKRGNHNSYIAGDAINGIDISFKQKYSDVYNTYKALIAFRKANSSSFGANSDATADMFQSGVIKYTTGKFTVYFNGNRTPVEINETGRQVVLNEKDGTYSVSAAGKIVSVPATGFVIIETTK